MIILILEAYAHVCTMFYVPLAGHRNILHRMCIPYIYHLVHSQGRDGLGVCTTQAGGIAWGATSRS